MRLRIHVLFVALVGLLAPLLATAPSSGQVTEPSLAEQNEAAADVVAQLAAADRPMALDEIDGLDDLGPMPWLSLTATRSPAAVEAWRAIAEQLPAGELATPGSASLVDTGFTFAESEPAGQTGQNDTPDTGELIEGFGTGDGDEQLVTITGNLSGAEVRPPIEGDCESVEDDGAIGLANPTPASEIQVALCVGEIGDGPFGDSSGDLDFYGYGQVDEGTLLILDVAHISGSLDPVDAVIGIYAADGTLLASMEDSGRPEEPVFLEAIAPAAGEYFAAVAGCCELSADPFDSSSGPGAGARGTYEVFVVAFPPPCVSVEDDGSIGLANPTNVPEQRFDFCAGEIGDGPHGEADSDFYAIGPVEEGQLVFVDVFNFADTFRSVIGLYDADGNLLASAEDSGDPEGGDFLEYVTEGSAELFVAIAGCCELQTDPTDPASGVPSDQGGLYEMVIDVLPAPCRSAEDDGSIGLANQTLVPEFGSDFCLGEIGDGPHGAADTDFYQLGAVPAGFRVTADVLGFEGPVPTVIGLYGADGTLVASAEDSSDPESGDALVVDVEADGEYVVGVAGCCELQADPTDPASGGAQRGRGALRDLPGGQPPTLRVGGGRRLDPRCQRCLRRVRQRGAVPHRLLRRGRRRAPGRPERRRRLLPHPGAAGGAAADRRLLRLLRRVGRRR